MNAEEGILHRPHSHDAHDLSQLHQPLASALNKCSLLLITIHGFLLQLFFLVHKDLEILGGALWTPIHT